jgi:hypothetical protein
MADFDYHRTAGLYAGKSHRGGNVRPRYRRFETAAEAVRFAIEDLPGSQLPGSVLEVEEARFEGQQIRKLYDAPGYPFPRRRGE